MIIHLLKHLKKWKSLQQPFSEGIMNNRSQKYTFWMLERSENFRNKRKGRIDMQEELDDSESYNIKKYSYQLEYKVL